MKDEIDITDETFMPPYITEDLLSLNDKVTFYGDPAVTSESSNVMIPFLDRCYFDYVNKELVFEYRKSTGTGTVKSVCIGRKHGTIADANSAYRTIMKDPLAPKE